MMAVDRNRRSVATKLGGYISVSFCVLSTYTLQIVANSISIILFLVIKSIIIQNPLADLDVDQPPTSVTAFLGESASFNCSIREGNIVWYVDDIFIPSPNVPPKYGASFMAGSSMANCITSTLQIRAIKQTNNKLFINSVCSGH